MTMEQLRAAVNSRAGRDADKAIARNALAAAAGQTDQTAATQPESKPMPLDTTQENATAAPSDESAIAQVERLRHEILDKGFNSVKDELASIIEAARKPAEVKIIERVVERFVEAPKPLAAGVHDCKPKSTETWANVFGIRAQGAITVWDHPDAPKPNALYKFPGDETALALAQLARSAMSRANGGPGRHIALIGPAGTGKSSWGREFAARTGRPCVVLPMNDGLELEQLLGQTILDGQGGTKWQDGALLSAIRQPQCVVILDEVGGMRPAVGVALNSLLQEMAIVVPDTGERVEVAPGVVFIATNNTRLMDSGNTGGGGYAGVQRQNRAFADRFSAQIEIGYQGAASERALLVGYTGCTLELAGMLVGVAGLSRQKALSGDVTHGLGFRRLLAWTEALMDGTDPELAFRSTVLNASPDADQEALRQISLVALDPSKVRAAIKGQTAEPKAARAGRAVPQFTPVDEDAEG